MNYCLFNGNDLSYYDIFLLTCISLLCYTPPEGTAQTATDKEEHHE